MAENLKISQLAKDLEMKPKDLIALFTELGMTKQTGGSLESDEVSFVLQALIDRFPIENINESTIPAVTALPLPAAKSRSKRC